MGASLHCFAHQDRSRTDTSRYSPWPDSVIQQETKVWSETKEKTAEIAETESLPGDDGDDGGDEDDHNDDVCVIYIEH